MPFIVLMVLLGAVAMTVMATVQRFLLKDKTVSALQFLSVGFLSSAALCALGYLSVWGFTLPTTLEPGFWRAVFCGSLINLGIQFLNIKAATIPEGDVSYTKPLQAMTPLLITFVALTLGEFPGPIGALGVGCMMVGAYIIMWEKKPERWFEYFGPIRRVRMLFRWKTLTQSERNKTLVTLMSLGSATLGTFGILCDGLFSRRAGSFQGITVAMFTLMATLGVSYTVWYWFAPDSTPEQRGNLLRKLRTKPFLLFILLHAVAWNAHWALIQPQYTESFVAYVGTLKRFSILFAVFAGWYFFNEKDMKRRVPAAIIITVGAILIALDDLPARVAHQLTSWFDFL